MAHFYGTIQGARGEASRLGGKNSGLTTVAASWKGAVETSLYVDDHGVDCALVRTKKWRGCGKDVILYDGPIDVSGKYATDLK
jgi:hypothetical protein